MILATGYTPPLTASSSFPFFQEGGIMVSYLRARTEHRPRYKL